MSYDVGHYIDLSHLNAKVVPTRPKKSTSETARELFAIGTAFMFETTDSGFKAVLKVPVQFA